MHICIEAKGTEHDEPLVTLDMKDVYKRQGEPNGATRIQDYLWNERQRYFQLG